jgi:hypothetical protein
VLARGLSLIAIVVAGCGRIGFDPEAPVVLTYRDAVLADAPVGYWRLGDPAGQVAHDETGQTDGSYLGACELGAAGAIAGDADGAVRFDGATCQIDLADRFGFPGTAAYSVEVWAALASTGSFQHFFMNERRNATDPIDGYALLESPSGVYFERVNSMANRSAGQVEVTPGVFAHVVGVYDGAQVALYIDGAQVDTRMDGVAMASFAGAPLIGASSAGIGYATGVLDEIAVYDHALPADRIALHHELGALGPIALDPGAAP